MRTPPEDERDEQDLAKLNAEPWQIELLSLNPDYPHWGPHEDYMCGKGNGWASPQSFSSWEEFGPWQLDDLNECVNFYFQVDRASKECSACGQTGYNPETRRIADSFYCHDMDRAESLRLRWCDKITQDEVDALVGRDRLRRWTGSEWAQHDPPLTADEVNRAAGAARGGRLRGELFMVHDAINRSILIETRAKRLGVWGNCPECNGEGYLFTEPSAHVNLVLWWAHPRKGATRGIEVRITRDDVPAALRLLAEAAKRNAERFARVVRMADAGA